MKKVVKASKQTVTATTSVAAKQVQEVYRAAKNLQASLENLEVDAMYEDCDGEVIYNEVNDFIRSAAHWMDKNGIRR